MNAADKQMQQTNKCNNYHAIERTHVPRQVDICVLYALACFIGLLALHHE